MTYVHVEKSVTDAVFHRERCLTHTWLSRHRMTYGPPLTHVGRCYTVTKHTHHFATTTRLTIAPWKIKIVERRPLQ